MIAAVVGTRVWWGYEAQRQFDAMIAEARAQGMPAVTADLISPNVPDDRNAAFYFMRAAGAISGTVETPSNSSIQTPDYFPYHPKWHEMASSAFKVNNAVYPDVLRAAGLTEVDWNLKLTSPLIISSCHN